MLDWASRTTLASSSTHAEHTAPSLKVDLEVYLAFHGSGKCPMDLSHDGGRDFLGGVRADVPIRSGACNVRDPQDAGTRLVNLTRAGSNPGPDIEKMSHGVAVIRL